MAEWSVTIHSYSQGVETLSVTATVKDENDQVILDNVTREYPLTMGVKGIVASLKHAGWVQKYPATTKATELKLGTFTA